MSISKICIDCGRPFVFEEYEKEEYKRKGLKLPEKRCKRCRQKFDEDIMSIAPGLKASSYFSNAQIYGPGVSVEGGLSIEYDYYLVSGSGEYVRFADGSITFVSSDKECTYFRQKRDAEKAKVIVWKENNIDTKLDYRKDIGEIYEH